MKAGANMKTNRAYATAHREKEKTETEYVRRIEYGLWKHEK